MSIKIDDFNSEINKTLSNITDSAIKFTDSGLNKAAKLLKNELEKNSPKKTGIYKGNWKIKSSKGIRKISNSTLTKDGTPLSNILEFSKNGNPHISKSFDSVVRDMAKTISEEFSNLKG